MKNYVWYNASIFKGIRIDNAHSTPINVIKYMIKKAREIKPDLIVIAELFTNDQVKDAKYIAESGINALIR